MSNSPNPWDQVLSMLHEEVSDIQYMTWFKPIKPIQIDEDNLLLVVEEKFVLTTLQMRYTRMITNAVAICYGRSMQITFSSKADVPVLNKPQPAPQPAREEQKEFMLNPKYTFDSFVIGASNRFAHAASLAVAELPADAYNPLFLYGGVGLGKTHLMHAIGHHILESNPNTKLLYITSEKFTTMLIDAIAKKTNQEFREQMRTVDVLMVDDIQFISGKTATQEEFFHTFNELHSNGKQIIISSDRPPRDIPTLEERLRSRFEWGLIADIQKPDYETRIAILRKKADVEHIQVDDDVLHYIAEKTESNIRELEGSLTRVNAMAQLGGKTLTLDVAREALGGILPDAAPRIITPDGLIKQVAEFYRVTEADIVSQRRNREVAKARQVAMYLIREQTQLSTTRIGELFGGRDHSTVMYACDKVAELAESDPQMQADLAKLKGK
ncbi:MAG: chromosomal replication initiator protein DnaA [Clostridia bacterium]|nr:chromosomal replication initiator protein DnaA [Clostridia bacterium]